MVKYLDDVNQKDFNLYKDLADTIYQYYTKGIQAVGGEYGKSEGVVKIYEIISENIGRPKNKLGKHGTLWQSLLKVLKSKTSKPINGTTIGFVPGFSADLLLEKYEDSSLIRTKRLALAVSMLGPFYRFAASMKPLSKQMDVITKPSTLLRFRLSWNLNSALI